MTRRLTKERRDELRNAVIDETFIFKKRHMLALLHDLDYADMQIEAEKENTRIAHCAKNELRAKLAEAELANRHLQAMWDLEKKALENERESHQQTHRYCDQYRDKLAEAEAEIRRLKGG